MTDSLARSRGNEVEVSYNHLVYCGRKSCGCRKKEHENNLEQYLGHTCGTSLSSLKSTKVPSNNSTGCKGVYRVNGKYMAKIVFQKKQYNLGLFDTLDEAAEVRKEAENVLFKGFSEYYAKWNAIAEKDPEWAKNNPISIEVVKDGPEMSIRMTPVL